MYRWLQRVWYGGARSGALLVPLSWLFAAAVKLRRMAYESGIRSSQRAPVPVIVIGNLTAGGTGKTPTVIWLVEALRTRGFSPGVVSRGYGGSHAGTSMRVDKDSDPAVVGDEPVLIAERAGCQVVVDADRVRAAQMLIDDGADVVLTDDGLQHLRLQRDFEICVVDGARGFGNERMLPAGPLRDSVDRLATVDAVLINGRGFEHAGAARFFLRAGQAVRLRDGVSRPLTEFAAGTVHAVAAIGNPGRFFSLLRSHGLQVIEHALPDHAPITAAALHFGDEFPIFMTEKDAVKLTGRQPRNAWYVPVELSISEADEQKVLGLVCDAIEESQDG